MFVFRMPCYKRVESSICNKKATMETLKFNRPTIVQKSTEIDREYRNHEGKRNGNPETRGERTKVVNETAFVNATRLFEARSVIGFSDTTMSIVPRLD
ncbi:hypothetical protein K0M31_004926 [Melipona bicolor]|uniref:Uncharacterized protein n=1 Tax=Melipona bicolor TaxID=60889 RepID=A0AA40FW34_9HYME|nr:hypothetical protein K0M31_004926 [Melipona bicolor]